MWEVEYTDEFGAWWATLEEAVQEAVAHDVTVLEQVGPGLGRPTVDTLAASRFPNTKELRTTCGKQVIRILFAFDPRRCAILLIGGDKTGDASFYEWIIPMADRLYQDHLHELAREEIDNG
jgi:hypothetical protein